MTEPAAQPLEFGDAHLPPGIRDVLGRASEGWLKNTEVCDLLVHYRTYGLPICRHPPRRPAGGSVFLFDRRAVRFFRKDGHSWRKKADGKTVRETHEKLKVGNVDMLNCYYAHGDESEDVRLQRRCYWLLEADEDIVLVHYLSAGQMTGGPRSKGPGARAAASRSSTEEPEASDTTHTTSSDGSAGQRQALESPFLAKARIANAQSQAAAVGSRGHPDAASSPPPPQVGPSLRPRNRDGTAVQQTQPAAQLQSPLSGRPAAIAAAATRNLGYSSSLSKSSMLIEGQMPLLPTMSTDSFFNLVEALPSTTPTDAPDGSQLGTRGSMQRQSSGPLRIGSMMNAWDEEMPIAPHGHIPSLQLNASALQNNSMMMDAGELDPVGLAGSSLRLPSGFATSDGYATFLRGAAAATRMHAPGLRTMSGSLPRMQVVPNAGPGGGSTDFEGKRTFTIRPTAPLYGGEDSPAGSALPRMTAAEHAQGGWDPAAQPAPWVPPTPALGDMALPPPSCAAGLVVHQGGPHQQQPLMAPQPLPPFYSAFAQPGSQQLSQQPVPLGRGQLAAQQAGSGTTLASDISATTGMPPQISSALRRQASDAAGPHAQPQAAAMAAWVPDSGAEDVGGSKAAAARRAGGPTAVEAELDALQRGMLASWQGRQPAPAPLGAQVAGWQAQLEGLESRAQVAALPPQRSSTAPQLRPGQRSPGGSAEPRGQPAFRVTDYAPDWDSTSGGAKLLLTGSLLAGAPPAAQRGPLFLLFDQTEVPATVLQPGVLRATVPPHAPGPVRVAVSLGDGVPRSRLLAFEYRVPAMPQLSEDDRSTLAVSDQELQLRLVQMLLGGRGPGSGSEPASPDESSYTPGNGGGQQQRSVQSGLKAEALPAALPHDQHDRYLTLLLQREVQRYAAQAAGGGGSLDQLSPSGVGLLHLFAALGHEWGLTALLLAGAAVDLRDAQGRSPLHWAAARGHEAAVAVLLARKASPAMRTWPSAGGPPLTPADMAATAGHAGLAALLAEAQLRELLAGLKSNSRRQALAAAAAVKHEDDTSRQRKRTRAERSLYPGEELHDVDIAAPQTEELSAPERARRSAAALAEAYDKVARRRAVQKQRRTEQRQRDAEAAQRTERWEAIWQSAEGHTIGATAAAVARFNALVSRACQLGASLRAMLLANHDGDTHEEAAEAGTSDLASAPDYQTVLDQAVAHVAAIEVDAEVSADYERLTAALAAASAGDTAAKVRRSLELDKQPSQSLGMSSLKLEGSPELPPFVAPAHN